MLPDEDQYISKIHDLGADLIECVLNTVALPEGGFSIDTITRHDGGEVTITFSGRDETNETPKPYGGRITYTNGKWTGEWAYDEATVIAFHAYFTLDPHTGWMTLIIDSPANEDRAVEPIIERYSQVDWRSSTGIRPVDFALKITRERVTRYRNPKYCIRVFVWDSIENEWVAEDDNDTI